MVNEAIDREVEGWDKFTSIMYKDDRVLFDKMMGEARNYLSDFSASRHDTAEVLISTLIFQQQRIIEKLLAKIDASDLQKA
jgi:hypothetical protein